MTAPTLLPYTEFKKLPLEDQMKALHAAINASWAENHRTLEIHNDKINGVHEGVSGSLSRIQE